MMQEQPAPAEAKSTEAYQKRGAWKFNCKSKAREEA